MLYLKIFLLIFLVLILYQDIRYQAVYWIFFPLGFILTLIISIKEILISDLFFNLFISTSFILFQICIIYLFSWFKYKKRINIFKSVFGLGDLLFLIMILPLFTPLNFIVFFIVSMVFSLLVYIVIKGLKVYKKQRVPLAGLQSLFLLITIILQIFNNFSLYNDNAILDFIIR